MTTLPIVGHKVWLIAEGYIPGQSVSSDHAFASHEAACILNSGDHDAEVLIAVFFTDPEPCGPYRVKIGARRKLHLRFNDLTRSRTVTAGYKLRVDYGIDGPDSGSAYEAGSKKPEHRPALDCCIYGLTKRLRGARA